MHGESNLVLFSLFVIFFGGAVVATLALFLRQALPVAYIVLGVVVGSQGLDLVSDTALLDNIATIGILFLLFLLGLDLSPLELVQLFRQTSIVTVVTAACFTASAMLFLMWLGFATQEAMIIGVALSPSSSIVAIKLLPTTTLHHQHVGKLMISILLLQDLLAILFLVALGFMAGEGGLGNIVELSIALPLLVGVALLLDRYLLLPLMQRFDRIREYIFILAIGWCLGISELAHYVGLSHEMGAFIAGITMAVSPIAQYIAEALRPLRDFFLVVFFFSLGADLDLVAAQGVLIPVIVMTIFFLAFKPVLYRGMFRLVGEEDRIAKNVGARLGQCSEFGLLIAVMAAELGLLSDDGSAIIKLVTVFTFIISTYLVVMRWPSPVAIKDELRRD